MNLKYRPIHARDFTECLACLRDSFAFDSTAMEQLCRFWQHGVDHGYLHGLVMEDQSAPRGSRIYYFVIKAGLTEQFADQLETTNQPLIGRRVLDLWLQGKCPLLTEAQFRAANSPGNGPKMTMATLHNGSPVLTDPDKVRMLGNKITEWSAYSTNGYRMWRYFVEVYSERDTIWCESAGFRLVNEYAPPHPDCMPPGHAPKLYGTTDREEYFRMGSPASIILRWSPPKLGLADPEQNLLLHAFNGDTDEDLAAVLHMSPATVKKRWQSIYAKVDSADPAIFAVQDSAPGMLRGAEKKRRLINYLRHHMEELRPYTLQTS